MEQPLISVIMPAYNSENTIGRAIESVLSQTYKNLELIVIDDNSTDKTAEIAESYSKADSRVILLRNPRNLGVALSRNIGCRNAKGEFLAFIDSDDVWFEDKLDRQLRFMQKTGCDLSYTSYSYINPCDKPTKTERVYKVPETVSYHKLLKENVIGCSTVMIKASSITGHEFNPEFAHEDYALWLDLARSGKTMHGIKEVLTCYSFGGRSSNKFKAARDRWAVYRKSQELSVFKASYYMLFYVVHAIRKYKMLLR